MVRRKILPKSVFNKLSRRDKAIINRAVRGGKRRRFKRR